MRVIAALAFALVLTGCGASARQRAITATLVTVDSACTGYQAYEHAKAEDVIKAATSEADGVAKLAKLRATGDKIVKDCDLAYRATAVAATVNNDQSVASLITAASIVYDEIKALGVKLP